MKNKWSLVLVIIVWFAVITQYYLMIQNRVSPMVETTIRFFSYFTILTNTLVAIYFTSTLLKNKNIFFKNQGRSAVLTAITVYITIVGLVYQIILRHVWHPTGLQMVVDELLHTIIPLMVIVYWYFYENKALAAYKQIPKWLIYPLVYLIYILIRGHFSNFYPYDFVNVDNLGLSKVLINSVLLLMLFTGASVAFIGIGKAIEKHAAKKTTATID